MATLRRAPVPEFFFECRRSQGGGSRQQASVGRTILPLCCLRRLLTLGRLGLLKPSAGGKLQLLHSVKELH